MSEGGNDSVAGRLSAIERRLLAIEARLGVAAPAEPVTPPPTPPAVPPATPVWVDVPPVEHGMASAWETPPAMPTPVDAPRPVLPIDAPAAPPPLPASEAAVAGFGGPDERGYVEGPPPLPSAGVRPSVYASPRGFSTSAVPAERAVDLEHVVGLKWTGWVGAIILVIGLALGLKYAYDQGWLGGMPNPVRFALTVAAGLGLIAAGEVIFRRVNRIAASGFYGAGVAVLYLAVYAGQAWYGLFGPVAGVAMLTGVAAAGVLIAARADLVAVAAIAVAGAVVCPAFTGVLEHRPPGFRVYLLAVQAMAIGLCAWRATPKWWTLRGVALVATAFDLFVGINGDGSPVAYVLPGLIFTMLATALYQGELIYTTWRRPRNVHGEPTVGVVFSLCVTAVFTLMLLAHQGDQPRWVRGETLAWSALAAITTGLFIARRSVGLTLLGRGFYVQAGLLLMLAIPVTLDGPSRLFGWMILAIGLATLAGFTRDRLAAGGAAVVWLLAWGAAAEWWDGEAAREAWLHLLGEPVAAATVVAAALMIAGHGIAAVLHRVRGGTNTPQTATAAFGWAMDVAAAVALLWPVLIFQSNDFGTRAGLAYAVVLWLAAHVERLGHLHRVASGVLTATAAKWVMRDVLWERATPGWTPAGRPFLNAQAATGAALTAAFAGLGWADRRATRPIGDTLDARADRHWTTLATAAAVVGFIAVAVETSRAVGLRQHAGGLADWPGITAQNLWLTAVAAVFIAAWRGVLLGTLGPSRFRADVARAARVAAFLLAAKFAVVDVIAPAMTAASPTPGPVANLQTAVAVVVVALLALTGRAAAGASASGFTGLAALAVLLVTGSAEVDRYAVRQALGPVWIVRQVGWSIYWGVLAVVTLVVGFALKRRHLRLAALGLLGVTLVKVVILDLAGVGTGWRILSFLGLGGLLLTTSVLYGKFAGRGEPRVASPGTPGEATGG